MKKFLTLTTKWRISDIIFFTSIIGYLITAFSVNTKYHNVEISWLIWFGFLFIIAMIKNFNLGKISRWINKEVSFKNIYVLLYIVVFISVLIWILFKL
jgi:hypothetical protein